MVPNRLQSMCAIGMAFAVLLSGCGVDTAVSLDREYVLEKSTEVEGRQGIAADDSFYYVSGSATLTKYDKNWNVVMENADPFSEGYTAEVNHIGDIDVYNGEIYCGVEKFLDGVASNIQIAVYDADTLKLKRTFPFEGGSGQTECSGITVNPDNSTVWMCSWAEGDSGRYLYKYDLNSGDYLGKIHMHAVPQWIQGVAYYDGAYYVTADDGDADYDEPDHIYRFEISDDSTEATCVEEKTLDDVTKQGEIEGLSFDKKNKELLVLYNRGAKIIQGMPTGFYDGYTEEIHEVFEYDFQQVIILNTLWIWNDFLLPLLILNKSADMWTLPLYQYNFKSAYTFDYNLAFASFLFSIVPMIILYIALQKNIIEGLTAGAVKS